MTQDKDHFEDYPALSEIRLSPIEREDIWDSIEQGMKRIRIHKTTRGITMIKTSAAVVAALALFAGGIDYTVHHTGLNTSPGVTTASHSKVPMSTTQSNFASEIALIKSKGYSVNGTVPNATVKTASGDTLTAWITTETQSQDGYSHLVFFFVNGKYVGTDTAKPSLEITTAKAHGNGIAVTYPVYKANDSFAHPTGTPVTITYSWNGSKLVSNAPYPKQFSASSGTANYASEMAVIKSQGYSVTTKIPSASIQTASGKTLSAWICTLSASQDGHNLRVLFFLNGKYVGTDAQGSLEITSAKAAGNGIAVTYPVYRASDSFADPTGKPVTITYTWDGSKLVANKLYPKQFQGSGTTSQGQNSITVTSYATSAEASNIIASVQGANGVGAGSPTVNLGDGIIAKESAGMGHARYVWQEGNWTIQVRFYTSNSNMKKVAESIVTYLHTHMLPAPKNHGVIVVDSTDASTTSIQSKTTIAWQEGTRVYELQQTGNPIQALQTVVSHG